MNRPLNIVGSLLGLAALAVLVFIAATSIKSSVSTSQSSGYPAPQPTTSSSQPTAYPGPGENPLPSQENIQAPSLPLTPVLEEVPEGTAESGSSSTPVFNNGIQLAGLREIIVQDNDPEITGVYEPDLDGNTLVGKAVLENGVAVVEINLETGHLEFLTPVTSQGIEAITVSGNHVAWVEVLSAESNFSTQLIVFDLAQGTQTTIATGLPRHPDMKDGLLAWQEYHDNRWMIYGYDLTTAAQFVIAEGSEEHLFPRICSEEWLIYLKNIQAGQPGTADLYANNLNTGESILIGQAPFPSNAVPGRHHACDGDLVAWISVNSATNNSISFEQHVYDLESRADRVLNMPVRGLSFDVVISGDLLISTSGYDLSQDAGFDPFSYMPVEDTGSELLLAGEQIFWIVQPYGESWNLYTATIVHSTN